MDGVVLSNHPALSVFNPFTGEEVEVDEQLAPLVVETWRADIETVSCCEAASDLGPVLTAAMPHLQRRQQALIGFAYIDFPDELKASRFLNALADGGPRDDFYVRMVHWAAPDAWRTTLHFYDPATEGDATDQPSDFQPGTVKITFPLSDVFEMVRRLQRHNNGEVPVLGPVDWRTVEVDAEDDDA